MRSYWGGQFSLDVQAITFKTAWRKKLNEVHAELQRKPNCPQPHWVSIFIDKDLCSWLIGRCTFCERQLTIDQELAFIKRYMKSIQDHCIVLDL